MDENLQLRQENFELKKEVDWYKMLYYSAFSTNIATIFLLCYIVWKHS